MIYGHTMYPEKKKKEIFYEISQKSIRIVLKSVSPPIFHPFHHQKHSEPTVTVLSNSEAKHLADFVYASFKKRSHSNFHQR
jgi:hypothetical protein